MEPVEWLAVIVGVVAVVVIAIVYAAANSSTTSTVGPVDAGPADAGQELVAGWEMEIMCIHKQPRSDRYNHIQTVGGRNHTRGENFRLTQQQCITYIQRGAQMFVKGPEGRVPVVAITKEQPTVGRTTYIATVADGTKADNLLALPECG